MTALTVHNAEIKTAAVEVKTLTISGKQVTLAVFRQLQEKPLISHDGTFNGLPWGTVNYHPDKCGDSARHVHVVWQRNMDDIFCETAILPTGPWRNGGPTHVCPDAGNRKELWRQMSADITDEKARRARWDARWAEIADLPQLFIAV